MNAQQIRDDVTRLAQPQGRMVGTSGHDAAAEYLIGRLSQLGIDPYVGESFALTYVVEGQRFTNLVGQIPGADPNLPPVLIGAHYDTCGPYPGADDNAAAVAGVASDGIDAEVPTPAANAPPANAAAAASLFFLSSICATVGFVFPLKSPTQVC